MTEFTLCDLAYQKSLELLERNSTPSGFLAAPYYDAVWSRDTFITSLGANLSGVRSLLETSQASLERLSALQSPTGLIPNAYWPGRQFWHWGEAGSIDGMALFIIAAWHYYVVTEDKAFIRSLWNHLDKSFTWLRFQDVNNTGVIHSAEASDWMDSSFNRSGKVLYVNVLYYWTSRCLARLADELGHPPAVDPEDIKFRINLLFWPRDDLARGDLLRHVSYPTGARRTFSHPAAVAAHASALGSRQFYVSHISFAHYVDKCDVLANLLAILCGIADPAQAELILSYLQETAIHHPFPVRVWPEPEYPELPNWGMLKASTERFQLNASRNGPYNYHNASIWPFVGGFYVAALAQLAHSTEAEENLLRLAEANRLGLTEDWEFREWLHGQTGEPRGAAYQAWNAGAYILAYQAVRGQLLIT